MAGKFTNTTYNDTVKSVLNTQKDALKNPYYKWTDQPPTPVTYFSVNRDKTTLDEGSQLAYNNVGEDSPFKYNKIKNALLYGIQSISLTLENDEFGLATSNIESEAYVLPNTWVPTPEDHFVIDYVKERMVFRVTAVENDTLEDGTNFYKITYKSSTSDIDQLEKQVSDKYEFVSTNIGTQYNPVIRSEVLELIRMIDTETLALKKYYKSIFYNNRVQAFTFKELEFNFYDAYITEFIRNNKLMDGDDQYIYIAHQTPLDPLFPIKYNKTFFRALETKDLVGIEGYPIKAGAELIQAPYSIFMNRYEDYYQLIWGSPEGEFMKKLQCFKEDLPHYISINKLFKEKDTFYNIIIKYFNDGDIDEYDIKGLEDIDFENNETLFFAIPCIIYCLESIEKKMMSNTAETYK